MCRTIHKSIDCNRTHCGIILSFYLKVEYYGENERKSLSCVKLLPCTYIGKNEISFQNQYSEPVIKELKTQLEACRQLLALEPDNKCKYYLLALQKKLT